MTISDCYNKAYPLEGKLYERGKRITSVKKILIVVVALAAVGIVVAAIIARIKTA